MGSRVDDVQVDNMQIEAELKEILIFAGTTEGRRLSECLAASGIAHTLCVATEYGEMVLKENPLAKVHRGRMDRDGIRVFAVKKRKKRLS